MIQNEKKKTKLKIKKAKKKKKKQKQKLLNRLYPSKKAETKGHSTCKVLMFVRSLKLTVFNHREIKIEEKSSTEPLKDISRSSHISDSVALMGAWRKCFPSQNN